LWLDQQSASGIAAIAFTLRVPQDIATGLSVKLWQVLPDGPIPGFRHPLAWIGISYRAISAAGCKVAIDPRDPEHGLITGLPIPYAGDKAANIAAARVGNMLAAAAVIVRRF
jgi:hypothetical protein